MLSIKQRLVNWLLRGVHLDEVHIGDSSVVITGTEISLPQAPSVDTKVPRARAGDILSGRFGASRLEWTAGKLLKGAGAGANPTEIDVPSAMGLAIFGDGSDGDLSTTGGVTLTRDMFYNNLTVNAGYILNAAGYRVFIKGTLTNNGTIANDGTAGANGTAASGGIGGTTPVGTIGLVASGGKGGDYNVADRRNGGGGGGGGGMLLIYAKTIVNNATIRVNGGTGGNGSADTATGSNSIQGQLGENVDGLGGNGGAGGGANSGAGGTVTASKMGMRALPLLGFDTATLSRVGGGAGGGGGGDASANICGGGGGGGGVIVILYNTATWGTEQANGGAGGTGSYANGIAGLAGTVIKIANA